MDKQLLKKLIDTAAGRIPAELVIRNARVVDVYSGEVIPGDIAVTGGLIAGVGSYEGETVIDAQGRYAAPGFIDSHIHIESSYVTPEELGRLLVPHGAATIVADPHEICNVCGLAGLDYMEAAARNTALDIRYMLPSCVPATPFEHAGAVLDAQALAEAMDQKNVLGLGEFMDFVAVTNADEAALDKLMVAKTHGKPIDGHSPGLAGRALSAYAAAGVRTDHECSTVDELRQRVQRGMYVLLREGSACHDLENLLAGVTEENSRRCLLCSDDRQPKTIFEKGHLDHHLRLCVQAGLSPVTALRMATLNAAECYGLSDRGAIAPGLRADIVLLDDLKDFRVRQVFIEGKEVARDGVYLLPVKRADASGVANTMHVRDFSEDRLKLHLTGNRVYTIDLVPGGVLTKKGVATVVTDSEGDFIYNPDQDIVKISVVERHKGTGNVASALLRGYGLRRGAVALSVAHDSHNIIVVGASNREMAFAVEQLIAQNGGIVLVEGDRVLGSMPMPIGGIMSDQSGEWVRDKLDELHHIACEQLGIGLSVEPLMTLCFMSLVVIPQVKLTDSGLFDLGQFAFISLEADEKPE